MKYNKIIYIIASISCLNISCKKFIETDPPKGSLVSETVFKNNDQATSALTGIYATMANSSDNFASGTEASITCIAGISSDELKGDYNGSLLAFYENELTPLDFRLSSLYGGPYQTIYTANAVLEGLDKSNGVTPPVRAQLEGEAKFIRGFCFFYLVNLFGEVPIQLTTDYTITRMATRSPVKKVYEQIIEDLKSAESLLLENYPTTERVRPNKSVAQAMLARVYLFMQDYENASKFSSLVIAKSSQYELTDLNSAFLANSREAIWQLYPNANSNANEGNLFIPENRPIYVSLSSDFAVNGFEKGDKRQLEWIKSKTDNIDTYYYPFKYKVRLSSTPSEYSMVLRLAEQYLIRSEAQINLGNVANGISDLNLIRDRARTLPSSTILNPLPALSLSMTKDEALKAVAQERKVELFSEWGHRWFDLKRTRMATQVLSLIKPKWQNTDELYPIPKYEIDNNPKITQNTGY